MQRRQGPRTHAWEGTVCHFASMQKAIEGRDPRCVVWCVDSKQADLAERMFGGVQSGSAAIYWKNHEGEHRVPMTPAGRHNHTVVIKASRKVITKGSIAPPRPKKEPTTTVTRPTNRREATIIRVAAERKAMSNKAVGKRPGDFLRDWATERLKQQAAAALLDAWGASMETRRKGEAVVMRARVYSDKILDYMAGSDQRGVFIEPVARDAVLKSRGSWFSAKDGESWPDIVQRASGEAPPYGLTLGDRQVGLRFPVDGAAKSRKSWVIADAPLWWAEQEATAALKNSTDAEEVKVLRMQRRGKSAAWWVQGVASEASNTFIIRTVDDDDKNIELWATKAPGPRRDESRTTVPIRSAGSGRRWANVAAGRAKEGPDDSKMHDEEERQGDPAHKRAKAEDGAAVPKTDTKGDPPKEDASAKRRGERTTAQLREA